MYKVVSVVTTGAGTTGAVDASASASRGMILRGTLHSVVLDYGSVTSITNVTIATEAGVIFTLPDNATDGTYYPRAYVHTIGGTAHAGTSGLAKIPIYSYLRLSVSSSTPSTTALTAQIFIDES
jgi:hypothetical protein